VRQVNLSEEIIAASTVVSAVAAFLIAVLTWRLSEDTRRYRRNSEEQLGLLREQWKHQLQPWIYFDLIPSDERLLFVCANVGQPTVYMDYGRVIGESAPVGGAQLYGFQIQTPLPAGQAIHLDLGAAVRKEIERLVPGYQGGSKLSCTVKLEIQYQVFNVPRGPAFRRYTLFLEGLNWRMQPADETRTA
jgi:hypothetical protein